MEDEGCCCRCRSLSRFRITDLAALEVTMGGATRFPLYFLKEPWLTACQGEEAAALFFFTHKLVLQAASLFFEGNFVTMKKKRGRGGEGAANPKFVFFYKFTLLKI
jgi:hypothetical protein